MVTLEHGRRRAKTALEGLYEGNARIYTYESKYNAESHSMVTETVVYCEGIPCRLSHSSKTSSTQTKTVDNAGQDIILYLSPDVELKAGSRAEVTQNGVTRVYDCMGVSAKYPTHQEVRLVLATEES